MKQRSQESQEQSLTVGQSIQEDTQRKDAIFPTDCKGRTEEYTQGKRGTTEKGRNDSSQRLSMGRNHTLSSHSESFIVPCLSEGPRGEAASRGTRACSNAHGRAEEQGSEISFIHTP